MPGDPIQQEHGERLRQLETWQRDMNGRLIRVEEKVTRIDSVERKLDNLGTALDAKMERSNGRLDKLLVGMVGIFGAALLDLALRLAGH